MRNLAARRYFRLRDRVPEIRVLRLAFGFAVDACIRAAAGARTFLGRDAFFARFDCLRFRSEKATDTSTNSTVG